METTETIDLPAVAADTLPDQLRALPPVVQYRTEALPVRQALYESAGRLRQAIRARLKAIDLRHDEEIAAAHAAHRDRIAAKKREAEPWQLALPKLDALLVDYDRFEEQERRRVQAELEAEQRRLEEEARLAEAVALEEAGETEAATAVLEAPVYVPPPVAPRTQPKVDGLALRTTWDYEVTDLRALVGAVASGKAPLTLVDVAPVACRQYVRSHGGVCQVPGLRAVQRRGVASR